MTFSYTTRFERSYGGLAAPHREKIAKAIRQFSKHPFHPFPKGLKVHILKGVLGQPKHPGMKKPQVWEMHAHGNLLVTFQYEEDDEILFRNCGNHKDVIRNP